LSKGCYAQDYEANLANISEPYTRQTFIMEDNGGSWRLELLESAELIRDIHKQGVGYHHVKSTLWMQPMHWTHRKTPFFKIIYQMP